MDAPRSDGMTRFERAIVFRIARGFFFVIAVIAVFVFLGGMVFGLRSFTNAEVPQPQPVEEPVAPAPLGYRDVTRFRKAQVNAQTEVAGGGELANVPEPSTAGKPSRQEQVKALAARLRELFPDPPYSWDNVIERYCAEQTSFGCLRQDTRVKKKGVVALINAAVDKVPEDQVIHMLEVMVAVLPAAPVDERGELLLPIVELERQRLRDAAEAKRKYDEDVAEQKAAYARAVSNEESLRLAWRIGALWAVGAGFATLIVISLFLAFLAMERHLRALDELLRRNRGQA